MNCGLVSTEREGVIVSLDVSTESAMSILCVDVPIHGAMFANDDFAGLA